MIYLSDLAPMQIILFSLSSLPSNKPPHVEYALFPRITPMSNFKIDNRPTGAKLRNCVNIEKYLCLLSGKSFL